MHSCIRQHGQKAAIILNHEKGTQTHHIPHIGASQQLNLVASRVRQQFLACQFGQLHFLLTIQDFQHVKLFQSLGQPQFYISLKYIKDTTIKSKKQKPGKFLRDLNILPLPMNVSQQSNHYMKTKTRLLFRLLKRFYHEKKIHSKASIHQCSKYMVL